MAVYVHCLSSSLDRDSGDWYVKGSSQHQHTLQLLELFDQRVQQLSEFRAGPADPFAVRSDRPPAVTPQAQLRASASTGNEHLIAAAACNCNTVRL